MGFHDRIDAVKGEIDSLIAYANEKTGESDTSIGDAILTLCDGYGSGGGSGSEMALPSRFTQHLWISNYSSQNSLLSAIPFDEKGYVELQFYYIASGGGGGVYCDGINNRYAFYENRLYFDYLGGSRIWSDTLTKNELTTIQIGNRYIKHLETNYKVEESFVENTGISCLCLWTTWNTQYSYFTYLKSYDKNGCLKAYLVPVSDSITNKTGFFDKVSGMFYQVGTGYDNGLVGDTAPTE